MEFNQDDIRERSKVPECMTWAGTGVLRTVAGGVPRSLGLLGVADITFRPGQQRLAIIDTPLQG
jgi:hypothetical protein